MAKTSRSERYCQEIIRCSLNQHHIESAKPDYEAVSYKWGNDCDYQIQCNGVFFSINETLYSALLRLRDANKARLLWVDEICIYQENKQDRAWQIMIMHRVYREASQVLIWLGPASEDSDLAMDFFPTMVETLTNEPPKRTDDDYHSKRMIAISRLFSRPWFSRVWTVQEAALANSAVMICGDKMFPFHVFEHFNTMCQTSPDRKWADSLLNISTAERTNANDPSRYPTAHIHAISELKKSVGERQPDGFATLALNRIRSCGASDDRDRIYSIWPFLPPEYKRTLKEPQYKKTFTTAQLFGLISQIEIETKRNVDCLGQAGIWMQSPGLSLPSWAADWSFKPITHQLCVLDYECLLKSGQRLYQAGGGVQGAPQMSDGVLIVKGKMIEDVEGLANEFDFNSMLNGVQGFIASEPPASDAETRDQTQVISTSRMLQFQRRAEQVESRIGDLTAHIDSFIAKMEHLDLSPSIAEVRMACMRTLVADTTTPAKGSTARDVMVRSTNAELRRRFKALNDARSVMRGTVNVTKIDWAAVKLLDIIWAPFTRRPFAVTKDQEQSFTLFQVIRFFIEAILFALLGSFRRALDLVKTLCEVGKGRSLFWTKGYMGLGPQCVEKGDKICIIYGCGTPFLLRPITDKSDYQLVGECYVDGLMDGEALHLDLLKSQDIRLV